MPQINQENHLLNALCNCATGPYSTHTHHLDCGQWKYLAHKGSGGNNYESNLELEPYALPDTTPTAAGQLYNLESDPGETTNLAMKHPEVVAELEALLKQSLASGRSRPLAGELPKLNE